MMGMDQRFAVAGVLVIGVWLPFMSGCQDADTTLEQGSETDSGDNVDTDGTSTGTSGGTDEGGETDGSPSTPTWHQDVAPVVLGRCGGCHRQGGIAPFPFEDYETASPLAEVIAVAVEQGDMPPFGADDTEECTHPLGFQEDLRLSDDDQAMLRAWADAGAPEGDPATAAEIPQPISTELGVVDQSLTMQAEVAIEGPSDQFLCFPLDPQLTEDRFLKAVQVVPGNDAIVHHVLLYVDASGSSADAAGEDGYYECSGGSIGGELVGAWAPGVLPMRMPEDTGMLVPAGARLVMNVHYHPTGAGTEVDAQTTVEIDWHEERPNWAAQLYLGGNDSGSGLLPGPNDTNGKEFRIPAGAKGHTEEMLFEVPGGLPEVRIWQVGAHMHYLGVDMLIGLQRENGDDQCLLHTPRYDFEWQRGYVYDGTLDEVPRTKGGDKVYLRCTYDNTLDNPGLVEALQEQGLSEPVDVYLGEETLDEMCLGVFGVAFPNIL